MAVKKPIPLIFHPNLDTTRPWGGRAIAPLKGLNLDRNSRIGESWEISVNPSSPSVISNPELRGKSLAKIVDEKPAAILGQRVIDRYGPIFPLLLKILDADEHLSVQVHPPTEYAKKRHGDRFGKEEAWYILPGSREGVIYLGLAAGVHLADFERVVRSGEDFPLEKFMNRVAVSPGECYFLRTGTLHALGKGTMCIEIQRDSDRTYRAYDFNRRGKDGKKRDLHISEAMDVIDASTIGNDCLKRIVCKPASVGDGDSLLLPVEAQHFQMRSVRLGHDFTKEIMMNSSFYTVTALSDLEIRTEFGNQPLKRGFSALVPAACQRFSLSAQNPDPDFATALLTFVPE